jgi:phage terminase small subunit
MGPVIRPNIRSKRTEITQDNVARELAKLGFANMGDYITSTPAGDPEFVPFDKLTRDQTAALSEVTIDDYVDGRGEGARDVKRVRFKLQPKIEALDKLGRHLGMFVDRTRIEGDIEIRLRNMDREGRLAMLRELIEPMKKHLADQRVIESDGNDDDAG